MKPGRTENFGNFKASPQSLKQTKLPQPVVNRQPTVFPKIAAHPVIFRKGK